MLNKYHSFFFFLHASYFMYHTVRYSMNSVRSHTVFSFVLKMDRQCGSYWVFFHIRYVTECVSVA